MAHTRRGYAAKQRRVLAAAARKESNHSYRSFSWTEYEEPTEEEIDALLTILAKIFS